MKTTLDLPADLIKAVKLRAVEDNRKLKDAVADLLRRGMATQAPKRRRKRVRLPLVRCAHSAQPGEEITPERASAILLEQESEAQRGPLR
jgi:hypothetical protein